MTRKSAIAKFIEFSPEEHSANNIAVRSGFAPLENWDYSAIIKFAVVKGLGYIPYVGGVLSKLTSMFWPKKKSNVWEETLREIQDYVDNKNLSTIQGILNGDILEIYAKMERVSSLLEESPNTPESYFEYKQLATYLVGKDQKFRSFDDKTNYLLLPMYASMILLQVSYWRTGIERHKDIDLTDLDIKTIRDDINKLVDDSRKYVTKTYSKERERALNESTATSVTNDMFTVRGYCLLHGIEAIEVIDSIRLHGLDSGFNIDVISYSTAEGTVTAGTRTQALRSDDKMKEPLRPRWMGEDVNQIKSITGFIGPRIESRDTIGGLRVEFEDGSSYELGAISSTKYSLDFNGSKLARVEVWRQGLLEEVLFTLDDGRTLQIGLKSSKASYKKFEIEDHYVAGLFLDRDESTYRGRAANIVVSYHIIKD